MQIEFYQAFTITQHNGNTIIGLEDDYVPSVEWDEGVLELDSLDWSVVTGYSNQQGIDNGIMHTSETFSEGMLNDMVSDTAMYAIAEVVDYNEPDESLGWVILTKTK